MIRVRLISVLTINEGVLYRTRNFIPDYRYGLNFVDGWDIDEVILLDITRNKTSESNYIFYCLIEKLTSQFFVPLAVGGGIRSIDDCLKLLEHGADKVILNTAGLKSPGLITNIANSIGSQSLVVSIDAKRIDNDTYEVMSDFGRGSTGLSPETWAKSAENLGAGELMLSSIDRDGTLEGYDNILNRMVSDAVRVPVVVSGGAGQWKHFVDAINSGGASGVCTSNIYHFTATSIISAKTYMQKYGINVRT